MAETQREPCPLQHINFLFPFWPLSQLFFQSETLSGFASPFHCALFRVDARFAAGSDGRFGLRRFRAKHKPTAFGTRRAFTHALPPSFALRFVPSPVSPCFSSLPLQVKEKTSRHRQKGKNNEIRRDQEQNQRGSQLSGGSFGVG